MENKKEKVALNDELLEKIAGGQQETFTENEEISPTPVGECLSSPTRKHEFAIADDWAFRCHYCGKLR